MPSEEQDARNDERMRNQNEADDTQGSESGYEDQESDVTGPQTTGEASD